MTLNNWENTNKVSSLNGEILTQFTRLSETKFLVETTYFYKMGDSCEQTSLAATITSIEAKMIYETLKKDKE